MSEPTFLPLRVIHKLHARSLAEFGGSEGVRDPGGLEAAVFHPQNVYYYTQGDLFDIAAAYAFHIAEAQAFIDGNKRTALAAALTFLELNGVDTQTQTDALHEAMLAIAAKTMAKTDLAELFRRLFPK